MDFDSSPRTAVRTSRIQGRRQAAALFILTKGCSPEATRLVKIEKMQKIAVLFRKILGYAAPECYCEAATEVPAPVKHVSERGKMSIESDIFSFGATFWSALL